VSVSRLSLTGVSRRAASRLLVANGRVLTRGNVTSHSSRTPFAPHPAAPWDSPPVCSCQARHGFPLRVFWWRTAYSLRMRSSGALRSRVCIKCDPSERRFASSITIVTIGMLWSRVLEV
jgi:hypothetical protein